MYNELLFSSVYVQNITNKHSDDNLFMRINKKKFPRLYLSLEKLHVDW